MLEQNALDLEKEIGWFTQVVDLRLKLYFDEECESDSIFELSPPELLASGSPYAGFVSHYELQFSERIILLLGLIPHIRPQVLDVFLVKNSSTDRHFSEFGGYRLEASNGFAPTKETAAFILAGNDLAIRFRVQQLLSGDHFFQSHHIFETGQHPANNQSESHTPLLVNPEYLSLLTIGQPYRPDFSPQFPAQRIETDLTWDDLVLHPSTRSQLEEVRIWLEHGDTLLTQMKMQGKLRVGYRALFYGPPGTGKTMTAMLLGKAFKREVYRVDLSLVVSKYIGETEKNLAKVFEQAQNRDWILFFDEADALFGKRGDTRNAHDRYANQEVAYLLQRVETFDGIAILASNKKENMDDAFARRFESMIYFPIPAAEERLHLWRNGFPKKLRISKKIDLEEIAQKYELSGGSIMNVVRFASLKALQASRKSISKDHLIEGIRREFTKEGKRI